MQTYHVVLAATGCKLELQLVRDPKKYENRFTSSVAHDSYFYQLIREIKGMCVTAAGVLLV